MDYAEKSIALAKSLGFNHESKSVYQLHFTKDSLHVWGFPIRRWEAAYLVDGNFKRNEEYDDLREALEHQEFFGVPIDWQNPDWNNWSGIENIEADWKHYVRPEVLDAWTMLPDEAKQAAAKSYQRFADGVVKLEKEAKSEEEKK